MNQRCITHVQETPSPYTVNTLGKFVTFECLAPAYQGKTVSTRIKVDSVWSEPKQTKYLAPTIETVSRQMGGNMNIKSYATPNLKIPTKGYQVRVVGKNVGLSGNAKLTWDGRPLHEYTGSTSGAGSTLSTGKALLDANEMRTYRVVYND